MEKLAQQILGTVSVEEIKLDESLDSKYKPGLFIQVHKFLSSQTEDLCTIGEQIINYKNIFMKIGDLND